MRPYLFFFFFILISQLRALNQPTLSVRFSVSFACFLKVGVEKKIVKLSELESDALCYSFIISAEIFAKLHLL